MLSMCYLTISSLDVKTSNICEWLGVRKPSLENDCLNCWFVDCEGEEWPITHTADHSRCKGLKHHSNHESIN